MLFVHSHFVITLMKKNQFLLAWGHHLWSLHSLPWSAWIFSRVSGFFPHPHVARVSGWYGFIVTVWVGMWMGVHPAMEGCSVWVLFCTLSCSEKLQSHKTMNWNSRLENLFLLIFHLPAHRYLLRGGTAFPRAPCPIKVHPMMGLCNAG